MAVHIKYDGKTTTAYISLYEYKLANVNNSIK